MWRHFVSFLEQFPFFLLLAPTMVGNTETVELRGLQVLLSANDFFTRLVLIFNGGGMGLRYWSATVIFLISFICLMYSSQRKGLTGLFKMVI
jgi:hypothetical protein